MFCPEIQRSPSEDRGQLLAGWGLNDTVACIVPPLTGQKSVGVHSFLPVLLGKERVKIVSGYTEVNARVILTGKSVPYTLSCQYAEMQEHRIAQGYTLSCLLITGSQECRDTLFLLWVYVADKDILGIHI